MIPVLPGPESTVAQSAVASPTVRARADATPAAADAFDVVMSRALERVGASGGSVHAVPRVGGQTSPFGEVARSAFSSIERRFATIQRDALNVGAGFDVSRPESALLVYERQVRLTSSLIEYQCILQGADNLKHAIKSLTQLQG
ncbi:MAG: hypothetical protein RJA99_3922 [Pseudomonadota bacterium]|jgi:hypothetical protein